MKKLTFKNIVICLYILAVLGFVSIFAVFKITTHQAQTKARHIIDTAYQDHKPQTHHDKVTALTNYVFEHFNETDPSSDILLKLRPYLTSQYLPAPFKLQSGVIETHIGKGLCDNAARMLDFLLAQEGYDSKQWNMVTDKAGHSALLVFLPDEQYMMADPFYGFVSSAPLHPAIAQKQIRDGKSFKRFFRELGPESKRRFYQDFAHTKMAAEGDDLILRAKLPMVTNNDMIMLGKIDGQSNDVKSAAQKHGMSPYWQYMGHRYNREWVRILEADQSVILTFTLTQPAEHGIITSTPQPAINGKELIWTLDKGDEIIFRDGDAKISLKRLNSYIDVDRITVKPASQNSPAS